MAQEVKALPKIAQTAFAQLNQVVEREIEALAAQAAEVMGIDPKDGWKFDVQQMQFTREVKE